MCVCVCTQLLNCVRLCNTIDHSPPGSSVHRISQARVLEWVAISFSRGSPCAQGSNLHLPHCRQILYHLIYLGKSSDKGSRNGEYVPEVFSINFKVTTSREIVHLFKVQVTVKKLNLLSKANIQELIL